MNLPGYDDWKTSNPNDDLCEHCGVHPHDCRDGWQPDACTGECGRIWRDPDAEREELRDSADRVERLAVLARSAIIEGIVMAAFFATAFVWLGVASGRI